MKYTGAPERAVIAFEDALGNPVDVSSANALPVTGGGGGGGGSLSDTVFVDSTGQLFVYRDTGSGVPNAFSIPTWASYTPVAPVSFPGGGAGGSALSDSVFMDSTGQLFVYRDTGLGTPNAFKIPGWTSYTPVGEVSAPTDSTNELLLTRVLNYLNAPQGYDKSLQALRITGTLPTVTTVGTVTTVTTVSTVTTCSTVTNLSTIDTLQGRIQVYGQNLAGWAATVRARIT